MKNNKNYSQLSCEERDKIAILHAQGVSINIIAHMLNRNKSTISRELQRNRTPVYGIYLAHKAHNRAMMRKTLAGRRPLLKSALTKRYVIGHLKAGWSPEQIAGRMCQDYPKHSISYEAIYQFIYSLEGRRLNLKEHLPRAHRIRQCRGFSRKHSKSHIPCRVLIDQRPCDVESRLTAGHWEADSVASRRTQLAAIAVTLERTSRFMRLAKLRRKTSLCFSNALINCLGSYPQDLRKTITYDNGPENVHHQRTNKYLGTQSYFCRPYQSWQKGSVEYAVGLVRRYLPKKTDFSTITGTQLKKIETRINNRPRKCLAFKTPSEVLCQSVALPR
jgi:IS30 family transposase